jgi:hypothetical protein
MTLVKGSVFLEHEGKAPCEIIWSVTEIRSRLETERHWPTGDESVNDEGSTRILLKTDDD